MSDERTAEGSPNPGAPSPEGVTGDPGAAGPLEAEREHESGLAGGDTDADAGGYGALDPGELAEGVGAGTLGNTDPGARLASPAPERQTEPGEGGARGEL